MCGKDKLRLLNIFKKKVSEKTDFQKSESSIDEFIRIWEENDRHFSKKGICLLYDIPYDGKDEIYTKINYISKAEKGNLLIVSCKETDKEKTDKLKRALEDKEATRLLCAKQIKDFPCLIVPQKNIYKNALKIFKPIRKQYDYEAVVVTGSYGKTTTTLMINSVLNYRFNVFSDNMTENAMSTVLSRMQEAKKEHQIFIQEACEAPKFGMCGKISKLLKPKIAVITSVGNVHIDTMGTKERILKSCLTVQKGLLKEGTLIVNGDDPMLRSVDTQCNTKYYGYKNKNVDYYANDIHIIDNKVNFNVCYQNKKFPATIEGNGIHNVQNAMAAIAVGQEMGMTIEECVEGLKAYRPEGIRQNQVEVNGYHLYLDCYNACEESIKKAIETIESIKISPKGKRIAVLADVKGLGEQTEQIHRSIGNYVSAANIDTLLCYGKNAKIIAEEAENNKRLEIKNVESVQEIIDYIKLKVTENDIVLLKGSRAMELERVYEGLK